MPESRFIFFSLPTSGGFFFYSKAALPSVQKCDRFLLRPRSFCSIENAKTSATSSADDVDLWPKNRPRSPTKQKTAVNNQFSAQPVSLSVDSKSRRPFLPFKISHPHIFDEWHPTRNIDTSSNVSYTSLKRVWWQCPEDTSHEWLATIFWRSRGGGGCPVCRKSRKAVAMMKEKEREKDNQNHSSGIPMMKVVSKGVTLAKGRPDLATQFHPSLNGDLSPDNICIGSGKKVWWTCSLYPSHIWQASVLSRAKHKSNCPWCSNMTGFVSTERSLAALHPEIARELHPEKNGPIPATQLAPFSTYRFWWKCTTYPQHEWQATVRSRVQNQTSCPMCSVPKYAPGTLLVDIRPDLAKEFDDPRTDVKILTYGSMRIVWWKCAPHGHRWQARVWSRIRGTGCPYCAHRKAYAGYSLLSEFPDVAREWHPTKNIDLKPSEVLPSSSQPAWFLCPICNGSWQTRIRVRTRGSKCPVCTLPGRKRSKTDPEGASTEAT
mmetsp:Transcript_1971/g.3013  ORF Transcript_1971/g.3013 Transcript_1971/m.3013 type:complete len:491 (-) Transcript_1971:264-1736(-)